MGKSKRIFDKKNSITFKLVHRSQRDPLISDEGAPQHVLYELPTKTKRKKTGKVDTIAPVDKKTELVKYGIYYDDDYDYMQHLKDKDDVVQVENDWVVKEEKGKLKDGSGRTMLPSCMFPSEVEEDEGMLSKAALPVGPQPDWDPDVVAGLDDDFEFEDPNNQIDDDFVSQALGAELDGVSGQVLGNIVEGEEEDVEDSDQEWESDDEDMGSEVSEDEDKLGERAFLKEETKSHFTNYSMSSSVMRRNKGLTLLDERFETLFENEYGDDTEMGPLDVEDIEGHIDPNNSELLNSLILEYQESKVKRNFDAEPRLHRTIPEEDYGKDELVDIELELTGKYNKEDRFDCESILSTYSNLYNHPKLIYEPTKARSTKIKINAKTGIPCGVLSKPGLTAKSLKELEQLGESLAPFDTRSIMSATSRLSQLSLRPKDETPEERKKRKQEIKAFRKERRMERKANQVAFKQENHRQEQELRNVRQNLACVKLV